MAAACDEPGQLTVPGLPLPGTPAFERAPQVTIPPPTAAPTLPPDMATSCGAGQVNINTASEQELQRIVHIGPERSAVLVSLRHGTHHPHTHPHAAPGQRRSRRRLIDA